MTSLLESFKTLFGEEKYWKYLRQLAWIGDMLALPKGEAHRGMCWRILLGILPKESNISIWKQKLDQQIIDFEVIRSENVVKVDQTERDPLTALSMGPDQSGAWGSFYRDMELQNFMNGDLDRLYMNSIPDEYFQVKSRRDILLTVLFVWSMRHKTISYRQGMHEIAGVILLVLEQEREGWNKVDDEAHPLKSCFTDESLMPHVYWIFERVLDELQVLYDPEPTKGNEGADMPQIVHFCSKVQEHFLSQLDPDLCQTLESLSIPGQVYGMRWSRLLFSREFPVTHTQCLRIWDHIFATSGDIDDDPANRIDDQETFDLVLKHRYRPYTPMLAAIGDFMMALMIQIREQIVGSDCSTVLMLLMRYPPLNDVRPILDKADMIRRGVLPQDAHVHKTESAPPSPHPLASDDPNLSHTGPNAGVGPNWLLSTLTPAVDNIVRVLNANGVFIPGDGSHAHPHPAQGRAQAPVHTRRQPAPRTEASGDGDSDDGLDDGAQDANNAAAGGGGDGGQQFDDPLRFFMFSKTSNSTSPSKGSGQQASNSGPDSTQPASKNTATNHQSSEPQINTHVFTGVPVFSKQSSSSSTQDSSKVSTPPGKRFGIFNRQRFKDRQSSASAELNHESQLKISQHLLDIASSLQAHAISSSGLVKEAPNIAISDSSTQTTNSTAQPSHSDSPNSHILEVIGKLRGLAHVLNGHTTLDLFESFYSAGHTTGNTHVSAVEVDAFKTDHIETEVNEVVDTGDSVSDPSPLVIQPVQSEPDPLLAPDPLTGTSINI